MKVGASVCPTAIWVGEVELSASLPTMTVGTRTSDHYLRARLLVRLHRRPLGFVSVAVVDGVVDGDRLRRHVWQELSSSIVSHLRGDLTIDEGAALRSIPAGGLTASCALDGGTAVHAKLVSIVVCSRDRAETLRGCLDALQRLRYPTFEVVVVDNAPTTSATADMFVEHFSSDGRFRYVVEPAPGLSRARNRGLAEAHGDVVAFTDDDVRVDSWWLHGIVAGFRHHARPGCVTGLIPAAQLENPAQAYFDQRVSWSSSCEPKVWDLGPNRPPSTLFPYAAGAFGAGANFAFDRRLLLTLGGFDEALGAGSPSGGGEDLDIFVRAVLSGRALVYEPSAIVWHIHRVDSSELRTQMYSYGRGLTAYLTKYLTNPATCWRLLSRLPSALLHARTILRGGDVGVGDGPATSIAREMGRAELLGMISGPWAYHRGRRLAGKPVPSSSAA